MIIYFKKFKTLKKKIDFFLQKLNYSGLKKKNKTSRQIKFIIICLLGFSCVGSGIERRVLVSLVTFLIVCLTHYFKQRRYRTVAAPNNIVQNFTAVETVFNPFQPIILVG